MLTLRYNEPVFILMLRGRVGCLRQPTLPFAGVLKELIAFETSAINSRHGVTSPVFSNLQQYTLQTLSLEYITLLLGIVKTFVYS